jgi:membrane fusion protein, copper/silver efflux system
MEAITPVYNTYFDVQMALAKDDLDAARKAGASLATTVERVDMSRFSRTGHGRWMELAKKLTVQSDRIKNAEDIKVARDGFFYLSQAIIELHKSFSHIGQESFYLTHCPMARDGDGAYWLQKKDIVWNSFYGEAMLRCGSIDEELTSISKGNN